MSQPNIIPKNRLLARLAKEDLDLLLIDAQLVDLEQHKVLFDIGKNFTHVYFIESGVASILKTMEDGAEIEVGMIGLEGMTPVAAIFGSKKSEQHTVIQLPGTAFKLSVANCIAAFEASAGVRKVILEFVTSLLNLSAQTAACNRLHSVEQRFARWLLMSSDRYHSETLPLTQEYLSAMLGVRRAGVTESAGELQRSGLIRYSHGNITIIDREGLEKTACECYQVDLKRFNRLIA